MEIDKDTKKFIEFFEKYPNKGVSFFIKYTNEKKDWGRERAADILILDDTTENFELNKISEQEVYNTTELIKKIKEKGDVRDVLGINDEQVRDFEYRIRINRVKETNSKEAKNYAYLEKENGEIIDLSEHINLYQSEIRLPPLFEKGILKTNVDTLHLSKNNFTSIEAHNATRITDIYGKKENYPINMSKGSPLLEKVNAPNCKNFYLRECDKLNIEDINIAENPELVKTAKGECYVLSNQKEINDFVLINQSEFEKISTLIAPKTTAIDLKCMPQLQKVVAPKCQSFFTIYSPLLKKENALLKENCCIYSEEIIKGIKSFSNSHISKNGEKVKVTNIYNRNHDEGRIYGVGDLEMVLSLENDKTEGSLFADIDNLECINSDIDYIYTEQTTKGKIYCEGCENLEGIHAPDCTEIILKDCNNINKIHAPHCKELYIEDCPELKEENINVAWDCDIKGLEKKNQLRR